MTQNMLEFGYRFASRYRVLPGKTCFPLNSNSRRRANSRRQGFVLFPSSRDTAVRVFQNPCQPMVIRADLALGQACPGCFPPYKHVHERYFWTTRSRVIGLGCINERNNHIRRSAASHFHDHAFEPGEFFARKARCPLFKFVKETLDPVVRSLVF